MDEIESVLSGKDELRLQAYLKRLNQLKESNTLKELAERDILLGFIMANKDRIDEFPMLPVEQESIVSMICSRMEEAAGIEQLREWVTHFMLTLNKYRSAVISENTVEQQQQRTRIFNLEVILLKCIQAAVYTSSLVKDNFNDVIIKHYGEGSLNKIDEITERIPFDASYWLAFFDYFVFTLVKRAYEDMASNNKIQVSKRGKYLLLHFSFDEVLGKLQRTEKKIEATRIQQAFEATADDPEAKSVKDFIFQNLFVGEASIHLNGFSETEIDFIVRMATIDPSSRKLLSILTGGPGPEVKAGSEDSAATPAEEADKDEEGGEAQLQFYREQVIASAVGAGIVLALARKDCLKALSSYESKERTRILSLFASFRRESLGRALRQMLEFSFVGLLREKGQDEGSKVQLRILRTRRIPVQTMDTLVQNGLTRIQRHNFFDKEGDTFFRFKMNSPQDLKKQMDTFQIVIPLQALLIRAWEQADFNVEFLVFINMPLVARGTTNLPKRIAEIMSAYGVRPQLG